MRYFGRESDFFKATTTLLAEAHRHHRDTPTVAVKRKLWRELLQVAIGQNSVDDSPHSDDLFVRHTYLTALVSVIVQAQFGIDVARYAVPEHRHRRRAQAYGRVFTPSLLAQAITEELITDPVNTKALDPSCSSGTFLAAAAHFISHAGNLEPGEQLRKLQENIVGIDLHPVAVQLAKATWVIACRDVIQAARGAGQSGEAITAPVYLGDSMQLCYDNSRLEGQGYITLETGERLTGQSSTVHFQIPLSLAGQSEKFDNLMIDIANAVDRGDDPGRALDRHGVTGAAEREPMAATITNMTALHQGKPQPCLGPLLAQYDPSGGHCRE